MEIAGFTFGVVPLVVMTFRGYRLIRNFKTEFCSSNRKLRSILRGILVAESIFKCVFNAILAEVIDEDRRKLMFDDPSSEYWTQGDLNDEIKCILGIHFVPMVESVRGTQDTLQEIRHLLLKLSGNEASPDGRSATKKPFKRLTIGVAAIATSILQTDPLGLHYKNIQIHSTSKRLLSLAKDYSGELQTLRGQLISHNSDLLAILDLCSRLKSNSRANTSPTQQKSPEAPEATENVPGDIASTSLDPRGIQTASQNLHLIVSNSPACECHKVHLCLGNHATETSNPPAKSTQLSQLAGLGARFSFQLSPKPNDSTLRVTTSKPSVIQLIFTSRDPTLNDPAISPESDAACIAFCKLAQSDGYTGYFRNISAGGPCNTGFHVQRATTTKLSNFTTLDDLIRSRSDELPPPDRFLIAVNLANSLTRFYSSPWIQDWSLETIHFFEKQEQSCTTPGQWTPHLPLNSEHPRFGDTNRDIHLLGIILLQLGQKRFLTPTVGGQEKLLIEKALANLCREIGPEYTKFVRNCLFSWGDRSTDLMDTENLNLFLSGIKVLEKCAGRFSPE